MATLIVRDRQGDELARAASGPDPRGEALTAYACLTLRATKLAVVDAQGERMASPVAPLLRDALTAARASDPPRDAWSVEARADDGTVLAQHVLVDLPPAEGAIAYQVLRDRLRSVLADVRRPVFASELCLDFLGIEDSDLHRRRVAYVLNDLGWHVGVRRGTGFRQPPWWPPGTAPRLVQGPHPVSWQGASAHPFFVRHPERKAG